MKFKKMIPALVSGLENTGYDKAPREIQTLSFSKIKSGADLFIIAPEGAGKTTAVVMGIIQQLKSAFEEAPRAIIMTSSKDKVFEIEELFEKLAKKTDLRVFGVFDEGNLQYQKDMIYEGVDVVVGTPKRITELLGIMGIPMVKVKTLVFDDTETIPLNHYGKYIYRIAESIENSQFLVVADAWNKNFEKITEHIMKRPVVLKTN